MKKILSKIKEEKGASSVLVLITVLTFACILTGIFAIVMVRAQGQIKSDMRIQELYGNEVARADEIYNEVMEGYAAKYPVTGITVSSTNLSEDALELQVGSTETLTVTVTPEDAANKNITYSIGDTSILTVENNIITALDEGTTTITIASESNPEVTKTITVTVAEKKKIQLYQEGNTGTIIEPTIDKNNGIFVSENLNEYYGKIVTSDFFTSNEGTNWNWQLFYDDEDYIFLIASDYVPNSTLSASGNTINGVTLGSSGNLLKGTNYDARFCDNSSGTNYVLDSIRKPYPGSTASSLSGSSRNPLVDKYLRWVALNPNSTNKNIMSVAFMMDENKWSQYAGNSYNAFAIGGPTIEMFNKSWNAYPGNLEKLPEYTMTSGTDYTSYGYYVGKPGEEVWSNIGALGTTTNMWLITETDKAIAYWVASPSKDGLTRIISVYSRVERNLNNFTFDEDFIGFRPVVCIPKSNI